MKKERLILFLLAAINFTQIVDFMVLMPLGDNIMTYFNTGPQGFSQIISIYSLSAAIVGLALSSVINKYDRKKVLLVAYAGFILGTLGCAFSNTMASMLIFRFVTGGFAVISAALLFAIVGDLVPYERRATAMGIVSAGFALSAAVGVPFGLYFGNQLNWWFPFFLVVALGIVVLVALFYLLPTMKGHLANKKKQSNAIINLLRNRNQLIALSFMTLLLFGQFIIILFIAMYMEYYVGFDKNLLLWIYILGGIGSILTAPYFGKLGDRLGKQKVFIVLLIASLIPIYILTNLKVDQIVLALVSTTLFFIFAGGRIVLATTIVLSTANPDERAGFMSIRASLQHLGSGVAAMLAGVIVSQDEVTKMYINYEITGYISLIAALCTLFFVRTIKVVN